MYAYSSSADTIPAAGLAITGNCGYEVAGGRVTIKVDEIHNHRDHGNLSGTLALELWGLKQPYSGGDFQGVALAGTRIGEVSGQHFLSGCVYDLVFQDPPPGTWYLTLMLREWNGTGYITRDHVTFPLPYVVNSKLTLVRNDAAGQVDGGSVSSKAAVPETAAKKVNNSVKMAANEVAVSPSLATPADRLSTKSVATGRGRSPAPAVEAQSGVRAASASRNQAAGRPAEGRGLVDRLLQFVRRFITG